MQITNSYTLILMAYRYSYNIKKQIKMKKDKSYFIRKDIGIYKQKFFLLCNACFFEIKIVNCD